MNRLYAEDLRPGQEIPFGTWTLSEADILAYAGTWDPLPIHADPDAASRGPFGGIIASGLQTMAVYQRLIVDALWSRAVGKAGRGFEVRFRRPVRPGTSLTGSARVASVTVRPERGDAVVVPRRRRLTLASAIPALDGRHAGSHGGGRAPVAITWGTRRAG